MPLAELPPPSHLLAIAGGGALGALCRAMVTLLMPGDFPWGTFTANVAGSLLIGIFLALVAHEWMGQGARAFFVTGFCGAFTTFSTFSSDTLLLLQAHRYLAAAGNVLLSVLLCLAAVFAGFRLVETFLPR